MSVLVNVRLPEYERDKWKAEAEKLGVTLSDFIKGAVDSRLGGSSPAPLPQQIQTPQKSNFRPDWKVPKAKKGKS